MDCKICGQCLNRNHLRKHNLSFKSYYDTFYKQAGEENCIDCNKPTRFINFKKGYIKRCVICSNREIGRLLKIKNKENLFNCVCLICNISFKGKVKKDNCGSRKCRIYKVSNPIKDYKNILYNKINQCPYCSAEFKNLTGLTAHLNKHFNHNDVLNILQYIGINIWKVSPPKCKYCSEQLLDQYNQKFYGSFPNCCTKCKKERIWIKYYDYKSKSKKTSEARKKLNQTEEGRKTLKRVGEINSIKMKAFNQTEKGKQNLKKTAKKNSETMKRKIAEGSFTPCITNTRTHWQAKIFLDDEIYKQFRSSWEAVFWNSNKHLEFESLRIPWIDENSENHSYIVDFYDRNENIIYEIKPKSVWPHQNTKMQQIIKYCLTNKIKFIWINEDNILSYIKEEDFKRKNLIQLQKVYDGIKKNKNNIN